MPLPTVFVCGVTGTQGGEVARQLRKAGVEVHALARNPSSPSAKAMAALGVKIFHGSFDDQAVLEQAMAGCNAAFLNFSPDFTDLKAERRWAKALLATGKSAGVTQVAYSSSFGVNEPERLNGWDPTNFVGMITLSKQNIENEVRAAGFDTWTLLRPGYFMSNQVAPKVFFFGDYPKTGVWRTALKKDTVLPAVDDLTIGRFGAAVFLEPAKFAGKEITYADELITVEQILAKLSAATGWEIKADYLSDAAIEELIAEFPVLGGMSMMLDMAKFVDMEYVKSLGIPLSSFDAYLEREKEIVRETYQKPA
jgi:uncharacterized protein YbjT (DUF2867 family)